MRDSLLALLPLLDCSPSLHFSLVLSFEVTSSLLSAFRFSAGLHPPLPPESSFCTAYTPPLSSMSRTRYEPLRNIPRDNVDALHAAPQAFSPALHRSRPIDIVGDTSTGSCRRLRIDVDAKRPLICSCHASFILNTGDTVDSAILCSTQHHGRHSSIQRRAEKSQGVCHFYLAGRDGCLACTTC